MSCGRFVILGFWDFGVLDLKVESAFEYARICRKLDYHNFLFSMKASNPVVMVSAYRLLSAEMMREGWDYPLHLGVTEAGDGEDGRMKSAIGIGALLQVGTGGGGNGWWMPRFWMGLAGLPTLGLG